MPCQDALASFDFLNKRNSIAVRPDLDGVEERELQHPDLDITAFQKEADIRYEPAVELGRDLNFTSPRSNGHSRFFNFRSFCLTAE